MITPNLEQIAYALDIYSDYDTFLLGGDFIMEDSETPMIDFLNNFDAKNIVKMKTCFKSLDNPSCIDLFITNSPKRFYGTTTLTTGLSDFHQLVVTIMRTTFPKSNPKVIKYRNFKKL